MNNKIIYASKSYLKSIGGITRCYPLGKGQALFRTCDVLGARGKAGADGWDFARVPGVGHDRNFDADVYVVSRRAQGLAFSKSELQKTEFYNRSMNNVNKIRKLKENERVDHWIERLELNKKSKRVCAIEEVAYAGQAKTDALVDAITKLFEKQGFDEDLLDEAFDELYDNGKYSIDGFNVKRSTWLLKDSKPVDFDEWNGWND